jgi:hypothetical protein
MRTVAWKYPGLRLPSMGGVLCDGEQYSYRIFRRDSPVGFFGERRFRFDIHRWERRGRKSSDHASNRLSNGMLQGAPAAAELGCTARRFTGKWSLELAEHAEVSQ